MPENGDKVRDALTRAINELTDIANELQAEANNLGARDRLQKTISEIRDLRDDLTGARHMLDRKPPPKRPRKPRTPKK